MRDAVIEEVRALKASGHLTAERVLERAKDPTSALHSEFCWDDKLAARRHRLAAAEALIMRVRVRIEPRPAPAEVRVRARPVKERAEPAPPQALFAVPKPTTVGYTRSALATALMELAPWRQKHEAVPELASLHRELRRLDQLVRLQDAVARARALEADGYDRPTAAARAAGEFTLDRGEVLALLRAS